jgi:alkylation response protein AidB-like acyl-CoA dehydrogenase
LPEEENRMDFRFTPEQEKLRERVRKLATEKISPIADEVDNQEDTSQKLLDLLRGEQLYQLFVPKAYGGVGVSAVDICIVREELSRVCSSADILFVVGGMGCAPIAMYGTDAQKNKYLPALARGEKMIVFCLTEPNAGSDIGAIETTATLDGDSYILNGTKKHVANPDVVDFFMVFAKTDPTQRMKGLSAFIVEKGLPGMTIGKERLITPHASGTITFNNYRVPRGNLVGQLGEGAKVALTNLNTFRPSVGAMAVGMAQCAFDIALDFAQSRIVFQQPLVDFQVTQFKLAEMAMRIQIARLVTYFAAWKRDQGEDNVKEASIAKLYATESAQYVIDEAVQLLGGRGITCGNRLEYLYRDMRQLRIIEGTSEIQKHTIARRILREGTLNTLP